MKIKLSARSYLNAFQFNVIVWWCYELRSEFQYVRTYFFIVIDVLESSSCPIRGRSTCPLSSIPWKSWRFQHFLSASNHRHLSRHSEWKNNGSNILYFICEPLIRGRSNNRWLPGKGKRCDNCNKCHMSNVSKINKNVTCKSFEWSLQEGAS